MKRQLSFHRESWTSAAPFRITGRTYLEFTTLVVEISEGPHSGRVIQLSPGSTPTF